MHRDGFADPSAMRSGFECYFNLSAASGRDRLLGEKGAGAASTGLNLVNFENAVSRILECENIFYLGVLRLYPEIVAQRLEHNFWLAVAVEHGRDK